MTNRVETDFLVLGSGIAGLSFALEAARGGAKVCILTKTGLSSGASPWAQGGIASVFLESDSFEKHAADTKTAGAGLCYSKAVDFTIQEGPNSVKWLIEQGVPFSIAESPSKFTYDLTKEGGHSERRILHSGDITGHAIIESLVGQARQCQNLSFYESTVGIDLVTTKNKKNLSVLGMYGLDTKTGKIHRFTAKAVILASGGAGKVYLYTTNPDSSTGDGIAMARRAGAKIANMEFMQFHPTCLFHPQAKSFLLSEALRGEGALLVNGKGEDFTKRFHPLGSLAPRDIVARAIDTEMKQTSKPCVFLDARHLGKEYLLRRFPNLFQKCFDLGIDMSAVPIPVVPAAHYTCGGVKTDLNGQSSIENLYAIGEVASTGLHGANRLASNSLLEGVVFGRAAAKHALEKTFSSKKEKVPATLPEWDSGLAVPLEERINIDHTWKEIRTLMWNYVGIVRSNTRLLKARARLELIKNDVREYYWKYLLTTDLVELRNIVTIADLIVESAISRKESRGLHYNTDYPETDDDFLRETIV